MRIKDALSLTAIPAYACSGKDKATTTAMTNAGVTEVFANHHTEEKKDIVGVAEAAGFTTLLAAAEAAGLADTLKSDGPFTVFAPTDDAFAALGEEKIAMLLEPENKDKLAGILKYHVISGKVMSADLAGKELTTDTLNGEIDIDATSGVMVNDATVIKADVKASNGVIHVIDKVLIPEM